MSYGYQGPPFPGQKPPNSFGAPPGTPSTPSAPPYNTSPYPHTPSSFGMPQPSSTYSHAPNPPTQPMYDPQGYQPQQQVYPGQPPQPYPSQPQQPYPSQPNQPYPSQPQQPYPSQPQQPYPSQPQQPYPSQPQQPYPSQPQQPYPSQPQQPYPLQPNPNQPPQHFSPHTPLNPSYGSTGGSMYPTLGGMGRPNSSVPPSYGSGSTPYPGGGHSGGRGNSGNFSYGGSAPYSAPAPRITKAPAKLSPTVYTHEGFNPQNDAEILRKAMKGFGTDEKAIIQVLANRTNEQRLEIALAFKTLYGKDLVKDLKSETSGNFKKLLKAMMTPLPQYYAQELHDALDGIGTDETVLIEILCSMSNHEIRVIKQAYEAMYNKSLEDDLRADTSGSFKRLMVSLCCANRDESFEVDPAAAANDAREILQAGQLRFGTDESVFNSILVQRNTAQLNQIFAEYLNITGNDIEQAIKDEFSGDIEKGLLSIVKIVKNRAGFFAEQIYKSMKGAGTEDGRLIRLIVTRSEIDMGEIKQAFMQQNNESLEDCISGDCSGDYGRCLKALIN